MLEVIDANGLLKRSVQGPAAHDAVALGNPVLLGGYAKAAAPTDVSADGDIARLWCDLAGRLQVGDGGGSLTVDDGGGALTVDGTVAATQSGTWTVTGTGGTFPVTDSGGSLTVDNAGTFAVQVTGDALTALQLIDDAVHAEDAVHSSGDKGVLALAVRSDTAAQTAGADGDYCALVSDSSGRLHVNVGNTVTVTGTVNLNTVGNSAASLGKSEDGAHSTGDVGVMALAVRADTPANRSDTDGDYEPLQVSAGRVWASSIITSITPGIGASNLGKSDSTAHTPNDVGVMALAVRADTPATISGTDGDYEPLQASGGRLWTSSTVTSVVPGTSATSLGKAEDAGHSSGDTGVMALAVRKDTATQLAGTDADYSPLITDSSGRLWVNSEFPDAAALSDGASNPTTPAVGAFLSRYDQQGGTWHRDPGKTEITLLASAARTADTTTATQTNYFHRGVLLFVNVTSITLTPGIRPFLQVQDSISGNWGFLTTTPTTITATGQYVFELSPGASTATLTGNRWAGTLPRTWRVLVATDDADSITYSLSAVLLP